MVFLLTCKNEEDPIKNEGTRVLTRVYIDFSHTYTRAANYAVHSGIPPKFELIQAFIVVLVTCKYEEDPIKNKGTRVLTTFVRLKVYGIFFSDAQGQLTPQSLV